MDVVNFTDGTVEYRLLYGTGIVRWLTSAEVATRRLQLSLSAAEGLEHRADERLGERVAPRHRHVEHCAECRVVLRLLRAPVAEQVRVAGERVGQGLGAERKAPPQAVGCGAPAR